MSKNIVICGIGSTYHADGRVTPTNPTEEEKDRFIKLMGKGSPPNTEYIYSDFNPYLRSETDNGDNHRMKD